jgi:hypothetical protein
MFVKPSESDLWDVAERLDPTIHVTARQLPALTGKFVKPMPYSRALMFHNMARRIVGIYRGVPMPVRAARGISKRQALIDALSHRFPAREIARVQTGPKHLLKRIPVREVMRRWHRGRAILGVTDLHIRNTWVEAILDTRELSFFNALIRGSEDLALEEMMTLVIASAGHVTDSHSDDPDGTNHCYFGQKLWLAWDVFEGMAAGLEDVERQEVLTDARFDMRTFLSLASSRWFLVSTGDTLFLPGNLTHKVLTLEPYIGIGSFNLGLPSSLDTLTRWIHHGPLWSINDKKGENTRLVSEALRATLAMAQRARDGSPLLRARYGYRWMGNAYRVWKSTTPPDVQAIVARNEAFACLLEIAQSAPPPAGLRRPNTLGVRSPAALQ